MLQGSETSRSKGVCDVVAAPLKLTGHPEVEKSMQLLLCTLSNSRSSLLFLFEVLRNCISVSQCCS